MTTLHEPAPPATRDTTAVATVGGGAEVTREPDLPHPHQVAAGGGLPIGRRVAAWRRQRRMSQQMLADQLGKSKSWVDKIERGVRGLDKFSVIYEIAAVLHVSPLLLLDHPEPGPAAAPRHPIPPVTGLRLGTARRDVDILLHHHLPPARTRGQLPALRQLLTLVYAAMAASQVDVHIRCQVIATVCTHYHPEPQQQTPPV